MSNNDTAAIYCRISSDPTGEAAGVERQRQDCERLAETLGLTVVEVLIDNDVSAFTGVTRPSFERLLQGAREGAYGHVIAWHPDRLYRRLVDLVRITESLKGVEIHTCQAGDVDLTTPAGRLMANTLGGIGQYESEHKADRIARRARQRAESGTMTASNRPRGWMWADPCPGGDSCRHKTACQPGQRARIGSRSGLVLHPDEAPIIAQVYRDVADGLSVVAAWKRAVAAGLDMSASTTLRGVLLNPRNAGLVTHKGAIVAEASHGLKIIDQGLFDTVAAILKDPSRRTSPGRPAGTPLGGGLAICPRCEGPLAAGRKADRNGNQAENVAVYVCSRHMHYTVRRHRLDGPVLAEVRQVLAELETAGLLNVMTAEDPASDGVRAEVAEVEQRLESLASLMAAGDLDPADYAMVSRKLRTHMEALTATLTRRAGKPAVVALAGVEGGVVAAYDALVASGDVDRLRAVLRDLLVHVRPQRDGTTLLDWQPGLGDPVPEIPPTAPRLLGTDERRESVRELFAEGLTQVQIAERVGISRATVRDDLRVLGLRDIHRGVSIDTEPITDTLTREERRKIVAELHRTGANVCAIARHVGAHRSTITADLEAIRGAA